MHDLFTHHHKFEVKNLEGQKYVIFFAYAHY
jgi:hypothetical protein